MILKNGISKVMCFALAGLGNQAALAVQDDERLDVLEEVIVTSRKRLETLLACGLC